MVYKSKMKQEFYQDWKRKTRLEESAIKSLKEGRKIILNNLPKEQIVAIYAKGSFPRREMNKNSDVDTTKSPISPSFVFISFIVRPPINKDI